ncbi:MAG TPA: hypothetical protein VJ649_00415 [Actinomycetes bacterium]|nr:hypothetical protein [Actinomycetes bacterium]
MGDLLEHGADEVIPGREVVDQHPVARPQRGGQRSQDAPDEERLRRLNHRDPGRWDESAQQAFLGWAQWHREHAADPRARPEVITSGGWDQMQWERWRHWTRHDPRWRTTVLDTAAQSIEETTCAVKSWIAAVRDDLAAGRLSLAAGWL